MTNQSVTREPDDVTKPTAFGDGPSPAQRDSQQQRIAAVLMTYCTPQLKYDGMSAWEIAGKIIAVQDLWGGVMPYCVHCFTFYCAQTHSSPREDCECGANRSVDDARRDYFSTEREPSEDELEERRSEKRTA